MVMGKGSKERLQPVGEYAIASIKSICSYVKPGVIR